ncbi:G2/M phase-specific E3 ubiquitin-protein ligase-like [Neopsephotus bourkii]|uniref:G2/M phase-specific E3 ubiquitin-protein ligase-like n=1 Tax=Neopsephotus bourkii TaxID=309878 RepID=UPI002AA50DC5|nr:G2/M phase-specific E3 ubiquitin-protein ligase-like [Neopsephotus bourkii]
MRVVSLRRRRSGQVRAKTEAPMDLGSSVLPGEFLWGWFHLCNAPALPHAPHHLLVSALLQLFASDLRPKGTDREGDIEFSPKEVYRTAQLAAQMGLLCSFQVCFVCGKRGATITCEELGCGRRFHLPCAVEGGCVTCYCLPYSSFCWEHRPQQQELVAPENTNCLICVEPVEGRTTYGTMVCPACKDAWFHRACIQGMALRAGSFCLQCPVCLDTRQFVMEMFFMGIRIPTRLVSSWPALCHAWTCPRCCGPLLGPKCRL